MSAEAWSPFFSRCHEKSSSSTGKYFAPDPRQIPTMSSTNTTLPFCPLLPDATNVNHQDIFKYLMLRQSLLQGSVTVPTPQQLFSVIQQLFKASHSINQASATNLLQSPACIYKPITTPICSNSPNHLGTITQISHHEPRAEDLSTQRSQEFWEQHSDWLNTSAQDKLTKLGATTLTSPSTDSSPPDPNLTISLYTPADLSHATNHQGWSIPDANRRHSGEPEAPLESQASNREISIGKELCSNKLKTQSPPISELIDLRTTVTKPGDSYEFMSSKPSENLVRSGGNPLEQYLIQYLQQQQYKDQQEYHKQLRGYFHGGYQNWLDYMSSSHQNNPPLTVPLASQQLNGTLLEQAGSPQIRSSHSSNSSQDLETIANEQHSLLNRLTPGSLGVLYKSEPSYQDNPTIHQGIQSLNPIGGVFSCKLCHKSYSQASALKMHVRTHTLPCRCSHCGKSFSRKWLLKGHERTHTGERPYACPICSRSFADRSNLRAHLQTHQRDKRYACRCCPRSFSRMGLLNKHKSQCQAIQAAANFDRKAIPL